jgi:hypothetical protein
METVKEIEEKREAILQKMHLIRSMKRGSINEQFLKVHRKTTDEQVRCGPYYVLSRRQNNKTVSVRLSSPESLQQARADVAAYQQFRALCKEYEILTEKLGEIERRGDNGIEKKTQKSRSKRTQK